MNKKIIIILIVIIFLAIGIVLGVRFLTGEDSWICVDGKWVKHGNPSAPMPIEECGNNNQENQEIVIFAPQANQIISSPFKIEGKAKGNWFFEASFPVKLVDANGKEIAVGHVQAIDDWMTENFARFNAELDFLLPETTIGTLIFHNDNPSGLPENDKEFSVFVRFK